MADEGWRPLNGWERLHTKRLGRLLFKLRFGYLEGTPRLSQRELAGRINMNSKALEKIEQGTCRTRRETLERIAGVLADTRPALGTAEFIVGELVAAAGPALAPESE